MGEVGRRFELVGRAAAAGRMELARYQLGEIEEVFGGTLPHAEPPHEGRPAVLQPMRAAFLRDGIPGLRRALDARDRPAFAAAFERTATACNGCHQASGHGFIEIPTAAGAAVPRLDPVP
jgi:cytochrome c553